MSLMTRFLRTRFGRAAGPAADLLSALGGRPAPDVITRATAGRTPPFGAGVVTTEQVVNGPPAEGRDGPGRITGDRVSQPSPEITRAGRASGRRARRLR